MEDSCLEEIAFKWMFHCGNLKHLQEQCLHYVNESTENKMIKKCVYMLIFTVDVGELLDFNAKLGNLVCNRSEKAREIFQEACFICIQTLNWIPQVISKSQIVLQMRYQSVPHFLSCSSIFDLRRYLSEHGSNTMPLISTTGIVSGMTSRSNYTQSTWYKCLNTACQTNIKNGCALHYPNCSRSEHESEELLCCGCGSLLEEDISCRVLGEKCLLNVISPDGLTSIFLLDKKDRLYRSISVYARDELINKVELGACYSFSLIPFREFYGAQNSTQLNLVFEANNLIKINQFPLISTPLLSQSETDVLFTDDIRFKLRNIYNLYQDHKMSPWSFTACLSCFFGDCISPPGTHTRLKLGLLLSLVSQQSPTKEDQSRGNLHILIVSNDILHLQRLLLFSKSFASRSTIFSPCNDLCYSISKDPTNIGSCMIHSGCLPLANNGVCVLTNLNELKNDQMEELENGVFLKVVKREALSIFVFTKANTGYSVSHFMLREIFKNIENVLQTESVSVEVPKKYVECQQSHIPMPVRCKIWACCETLKKDGIGRSHQNVYQKLPENGRLSKTVVDNFSLVFVVGNSEMSSTENSVRDRIVEDVLNKASLKMRESKYEIPDSEFFEFIQYASTNEIAFTETASELIKGFYLSSRRVRSSSGQGGAEFPIAALKAMMSLAEAHGRLSLRTKVTEDDAVIAIMLYEESISARVGYSVLGLSFDYSDGSITNLSDPKNDERMVQLKIHMKRFCSLHSHYKHMPGQFTREE